MAKKFSHSQVKRHRIYTVWEISDLLGCHRQTVCRWISSNALFADTFQRPWLIKGSDLKAFLGERQNKSRHKLALEHFYCFGCKEPRPAHGKIADYYHKNNGAGRLSALCPECGSLMNKAIKRSDLEIIRAKIEVTIQKAEPRLISCDDNLLKVTLNTETKSDGKAQYK